MSKKKPRRSTWTPMQGAARFAMTTGRAAAMANPSPLTDEEQEFIRVRMDAAISALWANKANEQHLYDLFEALNVTQALADCGAASGYESDVIAAVKAGAEVREAWNSYSPGDGKVLATTAQIEAIQQGISIHREILAAGLYGHELLQAMDIMKARQKSGQVIKPTCNSVLA